MKNVPLALTMGDPAGIGGEISVAAWREGDLGRPFFLIDDPERMGRLPGGAPIAVIAEPEQAAAVWTEAIPVLPCPLAAPATPGRPDPANASAVIASIDRAVALTLEGRAAAVVTNPISKAVLYDGADFAYPGHTEYLAALGGVARSVMMLAGPALRVVPVTIHIPLAEVPQALTGPLIEETARITHAALVRDFGIAEPRIAVAGLNPHAGEGGAMGREEIETIIPALDRLRTEGLNMIGPLPADTMFHPAARARYDVALTMYHDQGLIPLKALDFDRGVNVTLGLPYIRTSPDHGTAFDIAGRGVARATSLIAALEMADRLARARSTAPA